jgi:hypothetical protein
MFNKLKFSIKKIIDLRIIKVKVLITSHNLDAFEAYLDKLPVEGSSIFALDIERSKNYGQNLYSWIDVTKMTKVGDVYHILDCLDRKFVVRVLTE